MHSQDITWNPLNILTKVVALKVRNFYVALRICMCFWYVEMLSVGLSNSGTRCNIGCWSHLWVYVVGGSYRQPWPLSWQNWYSEKIVCKRKYLNDFVKNNFKWGGGRGGGANVIPFYVCVIVKHMPCIFCGEVVLLAQCGQVPFYPFPYTIMYF